MEKDNEDDYEYCVEVFDALADTSFRIAWNPYKYLFRNAAQVRPDKYTLIKRLKYGGPEIERDPFE